VKYAGFRHVIIARVERVLAAIAVAAGIAAWIFYFRAGLILSHYDAKAHLVVARRVIDNITPGWQQIGAVWLPLPHLINLLPAQIDFFYRTGAFASGVSILCFGVTAWAAARLVMRATGSRLGAITAAGLLILNPNLVYLYATPMTEPLLLAVTFTTVLWLYEWTLDDRDDVPVKLRWALFLATWTRYEAWPILAVAIAACGYAAWRRGGRTAVAWRRLWRLAMWPALAVAIFVVNSRITVGSWFVTGGFYVPDPTYERQAVRSIVSVWWGTHRLSGYAIESVALLSGLACLVRAARTKADAALLVPVSVFATAALPFYAFYEGHPYRIRYMIPMVAACALVAGLGVGRAAARRAMAAGLLAAVLLVSALVESPPFRGDAPMLMEAQWDVPASQARRQVTACLTRGYRGEKIMASMGSLAHYMQELSGAGFSISDFLNEGNGALWDLAMKTGPAPHAGWMLVEEEAEGGDLLAQRMRADASFSRGMTRVCSGGGVALYQRVKGTAPPQ